MLESLRPALVTRCFSRLKIPASLPQPRVTESPESHSEGAWLGYQLRIFEAPRRIPGGAVSLLSAVSAWPAGRAAVNRSGEQAGAPPVERLPHAALEAISSA